MAAGGARFPRGRGSHRLLRDPDRWTRVPLQPRRPAYHRPTAHRESRPEHPPAQALLRRRQPADVAHPADTARAICRNRLHCHGIRHQQCQRPRAAGAASGRVFSPRVPGRLRRPQQTGANDAPHPARRRSLLVDSRQHGLHDHHGHKQCRMDAIGRAGPLAHLSHRPGWLAHQRRGRHRLGQHQQRGRHLRRDPPCHHGRRRHRAVPHRLAPDADARQISRAARRTPHPGSPRRRTRPMADRWKPRDRSEPSTTRARPGESETWQSAAWTIPSLFAPGASRPPRASIASPCPSARSPRDLATCRGGARATPSSTRTARTTCPATTVRHIDWRAYARNDRLTVKLYREEITPRVDILVEHVALHGSDAGEA